MFGLGRSDDEAVGAMCANWSLPSLPSVDEVRTWLDSLGFAAIESEDLTEQVRRPVKALQSMALNARDMLRVERRVMGSSSKVYEAHVLGALACAEGVDRGSMGYSYVGARKASVGTSP
jgi:hypothetical protein